MNHFLRSKYVNSHANSSSETLLATNYLILQEELDSGYIQAKNQPELGACITYPSIGDLNPVYNEFPSNEPIQNLPVEKCKPVQQQYSNEELSVLEESQKISLLDCLICLEHFSSSKFLADHLNKQHKYQISLLAKCDETIQLWYSCVKNPTVPKAYVKLGCLAQLKFYRNLPLFGKNQLFYPFFVCPWCDFTNSLKIIVLRHVRQSLGHCYRSGPVYCNSIIRKSETQLKLNCPVCLKSFKTSAMLEKHCQSQLCLENDFRYSITATGATVYPGTSSTVRPKFEDYNATKNHIFLCTFCGFCAFDYRKTKSHMIFKHRPNLLGRYQPLEIVNEVYTNLNNGQEWKISICAYCQKNFTDLDSLEKHYVRYRILGRCKAQKVKVKQQIILNEESPEFECLSENEQDQTQSNGIPSALSCIKSKKKVPKKKNPNSKPYVRRLLPVEYRSLVDLPDPISDDINDITSSPLVTLKYMINRKLLPLIERCPHESCKNERAARLYLGSQLQGEVRRSKYFLRCPICRRRTYLTRGTFFDNTGICFASVLRGIYLWCNGTAGGQYAEVKEYITFSKRSFGKYLERLRTVCERWLQICPTVLGGPGKRVELATTEIKATQKGCLKRNIIVVLADTETKHCHVCAYKEGKMDDFVQELKNHVCNGSVIVSDSFAKFTRSFPDEVFKLYSVEKVPESEFKLTDAKMMVQEICTESVRRRGLWYFNMSAFLNEYIWRQNYKTDPFNTFLSQIAYLFPVDERKPEDFNWYVRQFAPRHFKGT